MTPNCGIQPIQSITHILRQHELWIFKTTPFSEYCMESIQPASTHDPICQFQAPKKNRQLGSAQKYGGNRGNSMKQPTSLLILALYESYMYFQPLWKILVSWDDSSQYMESHKSHVPNHQPNILLLTIINHYYLLTIINHRLTRD